MRVIPSLTPSRLYNVKKKRRSLYLCQKVQHVPTEVGQTTGLMGDRAARIGGCGVPVPGAKALGALGEELGAPTKAGAAPPRRGLPDEGGGAPGLPLVRREPPLRGDG
jgi:hypothetical protein